MNFLQETRVFSALSVALLVLITIVTFLLTLQVDHERGYYFALRLHERHMALSKQASSWETLNRLPVGEGDPPLLGAGVLDAGGTGTFFPTDCRHYWAALPPPGRIPGDFLSIHPIHAPDIYFLPVLSSREGKVFVTFFDGGGRRAAELRLKALAFIVLLSTSLLPIITWLFLRRAGRMYGAVVEEARRSPVIRDLTDDPDAVILAVHRTNEELERLLKEARTRANELEVLSSTLSRNIPSGLIVLDERDSPVECNLQGREILGIRFAPRDSLRGLLEGWPEFLETIRTAIAGRLPLSRGEIRENAHTLGINIVPLHTQEKAFLGTLVLFVDLTPWKTIEEELRVKNNLAALGTFASGIAHEFRNSLSTLMGYMKLLEKESAGGKGKAYLDPMLQEAGHINRVIARFLDYCRLNAIQAVPCSLLNTLDDALAGLQDAYPEARFIREGEEQILRADGHLLSQAIRAVAENACQSRLDGEINIRWRREGERLLLEIADRGPGIPSDQLDQVFVPFFTTKPEGTGLGLALAQKIISLHEGTLGCGSREGGGTLFVFSLPMKV